MLPLQPKDVIAAILIMAFVILRITGTNGVLDAPMGLVIGYYFAHRVNGTDNGA